MSLKCGIIGLPNVGKSTLFNALTSSENAKAENYPFCTIEPNLGIVSVPDPRLNQIAKLFQSKKAIPTFLEFVDIAGLVKGASKGEGLGNRFLSHIRETHSLLHVVRGFKDIQVDSTYKTVDIKRDIEIVSLELLLADMEVAEKRLEKLQKAARVTGNKTSKSEKEALNKAFENFKTGNSIKKCILGAGRIRMDTENEFYYTETCSIHSKSRGRIFLKKTAEAIMGKSDWNKRRGNPPFLLFRSGDFQITGFREAGVFK